MFRCQSKAYHSPDEFECDLPLARFIVIWRSRIAFVRLHEGRRLLEPDLSGNTKTTTTRMSGIITIPTSSMDGDARKIRRTNGTKKTPSGINPMKTTASFHSLAFNHHEHPLMTPQ